MARVDALPERAKEILKVGSVIEREFTHELIQIITGLQEAALLTQLSTLKDAELLYEREFILGKLCLQACLDPRGGLRFLLTPKKRPFMRLSAGRLRPYTPPIGDYYHTLAEHFTQSENFSKGAEYAGRPQKGPGKSAYKDAIRFAKQEVSCLERLPKRGQSPEDPRCPHGPRQLLPEPELPREAKEAIRRSLNGPGRK